MLIWSKENASPSVVVAFLQDHRIIDWLGLDEGQGAGMGYVSWAEVRENLGGGFSREAQKTG